MDKWLFAIPILFSARLALFILLKLRLGRVGIYLWNYGPSDKKYWKQSMLMRKVLELFRRPAKVEHIMKDELFGNLTWDEKYRGLCGIMTTANGKTPKLIIDGVKTDESIPEVVRNIAKFLIANEPLIRDKIAVSMSELYNGTWSGGDTITPEELTRRITLTQVWFYDEDGGELHYEADDNLFTDHIICASFDADGEIGEPELEG